MTTELAPHLLSLYAVGAEGAKKHFQHAKALLLLLLYKKSRIKHTRLYSLLLFRAKWLSGLEESASHYLLLLFLLLFFFFSLFFILTKQMLEVPVICSPAGGFLISRIPSMILSSVPSLNMNSLARRTAGRILLTPNIDGSPGIVI